MHSVQFENRSDHLITPLSIGRKQIHLAFVLPARPADDDGHLNLGYSLTVRLFTCPELRLQPVDLLLFPSVTLQHDYFWH